MDKEIVVNITVGVMLLFAIGNIWDLLLKSEKVRNFLSRHFPEETKIYKKGEKDFLDKND